MLLNFLIALLLNSCTNFKRKAETFSMFVYMGSPDLSIFSDRNISNISRSLSLYKNPNLDVRIFVDGRNLLEGDSSPNCTFYTATGNGMVLRNNFGNINSTSLDSFKRAYDFSYKQSNKNIVMLWGHCSGVSSHRNVDTMFFVKPDSSNSIDNNNDSSLLSNDIVSQCEFMSLEQLKQALEYIREKNSSKIDVIGLDLCYSMSIEILYELKDYSEYIMGSQGEQNAISYDYGALVNYLNSLSNKKSIKGFILENAKSFRSLYEVIVSRIRSEKNIDISDVNDTLSAVKCSEVENVKSSFLAFVNSLIDANFDSTTKKAILDAVIRASRITNKAPIIDLYSFTRKMKIFIEENNIVNIELSSCLDHFISCLDEYKFNSYSLDSTKSSNGISIRDLVPQINDPIDYREYSFDPDNLWISFLSSIKDCDRDSYFRK